MAAITAFEVTFDVVDSDKQTFVSRGNTLTVFASNPLAAMQTVSKMAEAIAPGMLYDPTEARRLTGEEILSLI